MERREKEMQQKQTTNNPKKGKIIQTPAKKDEPPNMQGSFPSNESSEPYEFVVKGRRASIKTSGHVIA
jgi:hypothetical protein